MTSSQLAAAKHLHFTGIKGVGMTAAALCALDLGKIVTGSDVDGRFVTDSVLINAGITVQTGFGPQNLTDTIDALVYTGAHHGRSNPEVAKAIESGIDTLNLAEFTGLLMTDKIGISVCGVGGKTTTTAMLAHIFSQAGKHPAFLVGAAASKSLPKPGAYPPDSQHFIVEADEYASAPGTDNTARFMAQNPSTIVCTNIAHDHPDIYQNLDHTLRTFREFFAKLPTDGLLVYNADCPHTSKCLGNLPGTAISVGYTQEADVPISTRIDSGRMVVDFAYHNQTNHLSLVIPGQHNAKNAVMATIVALTQGIDAITIETALATFNGVNRRFESKGDYQQIKLYDDYAHHPDEIVQTLKAAKAWFPNIPITVLFQPHTYSRTKALLTEFSLAFTDADTVIITDIFASAREAADSTITGQTLADAVANHHPRVKYLPQNDLLQYIKQNSQVPQILFTMGAGDIYDLHHHLID